MFSLYRLYTNDLLSQWSQLSFVCVFLGGAGEGTRNFGSPLTLQVLGGSRFDLPPPHLHFFTLLLNCFSFDNETLWLVLNIIKKHFDSKNFSLYPMGVTWRHHFEQQLDGVKICKFQLFMLCAYLRNKQVYFEIIACKTKTIINVWLLIISGNDYVIMTSSG